MSFWTRFNNWLKELASTNYKIFIGSVLALGSMVFYFGSEILRSFKPSAPPIDSTNWGMWLSFVAAVLGIAYLQFAKKRDTYAAPSPDSERAGVPPTPPPVTPDTDPDKP